MHFFYSPANFLFRGYSSTNHFKILLDCLSLFLSFALLKKLVNPFSLFLWCIATAQQFSKWLHTSNSSRSRWTAKWNEKFLEMRIRSKEPRNCRESTSHSGLMENNLYFLILWCEKIPRWEWDKYTHKRSRCTIGFCYVVHNYIWSRSYANQETGLLPHTYYKKFLRSPKEMLKETISIIFPIPLFPPHF